MKATGYTRHRGEAGLWRLSVICCLIAAFLLSGCGLQSVVSTGDATETSAQPENTTETSTTETDLIVEQPTEDSEGDSLADSVTEETAGDLSDTDVENEVDLPEETTDSEVSNPVNETAEPGMNLSDSAEDPKAVSTDSIDSDAGTMVSTVDELLSAIVPGASITLKPGTYDLSSASDYGRSETTGYYSWEEAYDGYQLVITDVDGLTLNGTDEERVDVTAVPRYANVITFRNCEDLSLSALTAGHSPEPGFCAGGVFSFENCSNITVDQCKMFGCGVMGIDATNSREISVTNSEIYECSYGAVSAHGCYDLRLSNCVIRDCGTKDDTYNCFNLFETNGTTGFAIVNSVITGNDAAVLFKSSWSPQSCLLGCEFTGNRITESVFNLEGASPTVESCSFLGNDISTYYPEHFSTYAVNSQGDDLITFDFEHMQQQSVTYQGPVEEETVEATRIERMDGSAEYHVRTVDEFLSAIGPDRTVYLDAELFDLTTANHYGAGGTDYYRWETGYDGPGLVLTGVSNFHLIGQGKNNTKIIATPLSADVLRFEGGENISVSNFTAGHTQTPNCSGDVLSFSMVQNVVIDGCGLYGCGVNGISTWQCRGVSVLNCEIYSCSQWAVVMMNTADIEFSGMDIHDMPASKNVYLYECENISCEGQNLDNGEWNLMY